MFRTVRSINQTLAPNRRLRILLGDPPIEWESVRTAEDLHNAASGRSSFPADVIAREVLAKNRRALVVYGALHVMRQNLAGANLIERVEAHASGRAFVVVTDPIASLSALTIDRQSLAPPALVLTTGSSLANQIDAILYLGESSGRRLSRLTPKLCADAGYRAMRLSRMTLAGEPNARESLDRECANDK